MTPPVPSTGVVEAVCVTHAVKPDAGRVGRTGIDKRPVGSVEIGPHGVGGDTVCDEQDHGGRDKAVYAYATADAEWWAEQLGRPVPPGWFGENLRLSGLDVSGAVIGEQWQVGEDVLLEVTQPRTPCATFGRHVEQERWVRRFGEAGRLGAYLRVLRPGRVSDGDRVVVRHVPEHGVTVNGWYLRSDPEDARSLLLAEQQGLDLAPTMVAALERALRRA